MQIGKVKLPNWTGWIWLGITLWPLIALWICCE